MRPHIGIILATYRPDWKFFRQQIESLRCQSFSNWFCLISDDSCDPSVRSIIEQLIQNDDRFQLTTHKQTVGPFMNFMTAVPNFKGFDFVAFCDQDDIWQPNKLEVILEHFQRFPEVSILHSDLALVDSEGLEIAPSCWRLESREVQEVNIKSLLFRNVVTGCSMVFKASLIPLIAPLRSVDDTSFYYHDQWVAILALLEGQILSISKTLVKYRQHQNNLVGAGSSSYRDCLEKLFDVKTLLQTSLRQVKSRRCLAEHVRERAYEAIEEGYFKNPDSIRKTVSELDMFYGLRWVVPFFTYGPRGLPGVKLFLLLFLGIVSGFFQANKSRD
ncbi:MAG: glycosyltransferase [Bdellovibrio sp.]